MRVQVDSINLFAFFDCWACGPNEKLGVQDVQKQWLVIRKHIHPKPFIMNHLANSRNGNKRAHFH